MTQSQVEAELALEDESMEQKGIASRNRTRPGNFILMGLDLEEQQCVNHTNLYFVNILTCLSRSKLQLEVEQYKDSTQTAQQTNEIVEHRNILKQALRGFENLRSVYMPGLVQFLTDRDEDLAMDEDGHPENAKLWLPSSIPADMRQMVCSEGVDQIEERLRRARAYDALDGVRHTLRVKARMVEFKNKNIRGQRMSGKSREVIDRVHDRVKRFVDKYRRSRTGLLLLTGPGDWEKELRVMEASDVRSYVDPQRKTRGAGRRGTNEEEPGMEGVVVEEVVKEADAECQGDDEFLLQGEIRTRKDGTGETRKEQSWIWVTREINLRDGADENDNEILHSEWCKSRARVHRAEEELRYLEVEMQRTLRFLEWRAAWWDERRSRGNPRKVPHLEEGVKAYAMKQAIIQRGLYSKFLKTWSAPLDRDEDNISEERGNDRAAREELGLDGRDDDEEEDAIDEAGDDRGSVEEPDGVVEVGEGELEEAECFGFA